MRHELMLKKQTLSLQVLKHIVFVGTLLPGPYLFVATVWAGAHIVPGDPIHS
jgi:hypothetical protein